MRSTAGFKTDLRSYKIFIHDCKDEKISAAAVTVTHGGGGGDSLTNTEEVVFYISAFCLFADAL